MKASCADVWVITGGPGATKRYRVCSAERETPFLGHMTRRLVENAQVDATIASCNLSRRAEGKGNTAHKKRTALPAKVTDATPSEYVEAAAAADLAFLRQYDLQRPADRRENVIAIGVIPLCQCVGQGNGINGNNIQVSVQETQIDSELTFVLSIRIFSGVNSSCVDRRMRCVLENRSAALECLGKAITRLRQIISAERAGNYVETKRAILRDVKLPHRLAVPNKGASASVTAPPSAMPVGLEASIESEKSAVESRIINVCEHGDKQARTGITSHARTRNSHRFESRQIKPTVGAAICPTRPTNATVEPAFAAVPTPGTGRAAPLSMLGMIALSQIDLTAGTESRPLNQELVHEYAESHRQGATFPPVVVYREGGTHFLAEGFHRLAAAKEAGLTEIQGRVFEGGRLDALKRSLCSNDTHGQRRTTADKKFAVNKAFKEFAGTSDRAIAQMCRVSPTFVGECRRELEEGSTVHADSATLLQAEKRIGLDGKTRSLPRKPSKAAKGDPTVAEAQATHPTDNEASSKKLGGADGGNGDSKVDVELSEKTNIDPHPVQAEFDPQARWRKFCATLKTEYAAWPADNRPIFVQKLGAWTEEMNVAQKKPRRSMRPAQLRTEGDIAEA